MLKILFYQQEEWPSGLPSAIANYAVLFVACKMGEDVNASNRLLLENLYAFHWYKMSPNHQKIIEQMIRNRQNNRVIRMGPFEALDYEASTRVRTTI